MKLDCTTDQYAELYARWLDNPGKLLDAAQLQPGERVLDLCGGTGIVALEAVKRGAKSAFVVDLNPRIVTDDLRCIPPFWGRAEHVDRLLANRIEMLHDLPNPDTGEPMGCLNKIPGRIDSRVCRCYLYTPDFDLVVCRQAINYLDLEETARAVAAVLRLGGKFAFNTFVKPPRVAFKRYLFNARQFFEASIRINGNVYHLQASPGLGYDVSKFRWFPEREIDIAFDSHFSTIEKIRTEKSLTYICTRGK